MSELQSLTNNITGFGNWNHAEKVKFFAWYLHFKKSKSTVTARDIKGCYRDMHLEEPTNIGAFLNGWTKRKPKEGIRDKDGYYLVAKVRQNYEARFGLRSAAVQIDALLKELPSKVPNLSERTFLDETLTCYKYGAFRAAIVMAWNLAFDHLCNFVLSNYINEFNAQYPKSFPKKQAKTGDILKRDDFAELKESEVIQICKSAHIIGNDVYKILNEKLGKRNTYAHPSSIVVTPQTAEEMILDLTNNVILRLH